MCAIFAVVPQVTLAVEVPLVILLWRQTRALCAAVLCSVEERSVAAEPRRCSPRETLPDPVLRARAAASGAAEVLQCLVLMLLPFLPASNLFFYVGFTLAERVL